MKLIQLLSTHSQLQTHTYTHAPPMRDEVLFAGVYFSVYTRTYIHIYIPKYINADKQMRVLMSKYYYDN